MAVTSLTTVKKRVISILFANRLSPYAGVISTPPSNSRYQSTTEIEDAALEADSVICLARMSTPGDPYAATWMSLSSALASGALIPAHTGAVIGVEVAIGSTYAPARFASSKAEIIAMQTHPDLYPDCERWAFIEGGILYHNGDNGKAWRSTFTKTGACQSPEQDELAVIALTLGTLPKDGAITPEIYSSGMAYAQWYINSQIKGMDVALPQVEQIESQLAA